MASKVCPLGLCRTEDTCPRAPCMDCMRRLGEHMVEEIKIVELQAKAAEERGNHHARARLDQMLAGLGIALLERKVA